MVRLTCHFVSGQFTCS